MPLKRELGLLAAIAAVCGESIALGIFVTPAAMAKSLGSPLLLCVVWSAMALMAGAGAACYARLAVAMPEAGGAYVYLRRFFGERTAFLYGWMSIAVMDSGVATALAVGAVGYVAVQLPEAARWPRATAALLLLLVAAVNYFGTGLGGRFMAVVNWMKLSVIALLIGRAIGGLHGSASNLLPFAARRSSSDGLILAVAAAFMNAFFSYGGWWDVTKLAGEIREPQKNLPRALMLGVLAVTLVYVGLSAAFLYVVPLEQVTSDEAFVAQFGRVLFGTFGSQVLSVCVLISVVGGLAALFMAAPRVYYAMAQNGEFFSPFGRLHPRYQSPANAVLLQLGCALALLGLGSFDKILSYIIFSAVLFLGLTASAVFRLREPRSAGLYAAAVVFMTCCATIAAMILLRNPKQALLGVVVVLMGIPLHWALRRSRPIQVKTVSAGSLDEVA